MKNIDIKVRLIALLIFIIIAVIAIKAGNKDEKPNSVKEENSVTQTIDEVTAEDIDKTVEEKGNFQVYKDEDGNTVGYNMGYLADMPADDYSETDFEKEVAAGYEYIRTGESYEDTLNITSSGILYKDVISMINKLFKETEANTYKICEIPENQEDTTTGVVYIVCFDYDYYILTYYDGEGVTALHDDTAYYASIYSDSTEILEDEEWIDEGYDGAVIEENIIEDDWLYSNDSVSNTNNETEQESLGNEQ